MPCKILVINCIDCKKVIPPQDWKALTGLGKGISGVYEIRVWESKTTYRVAYVTKFNSYVTVLHCWQKTTQATSKVDKDIIVERYKLAKARLK
jgi:phage-related protein